jgi:hypothetical protein
MDSAHRPLARTQGVVVQETPDEILVYDTEAARAHSLNETAAAVWTASDGTKSVAEIAAALSAVGGANAAQAEGIVWLALEQLQENDLMQTSLVWEKSGSSRRELLRNVGLVSAVVLPLVASLSVPSSVLAQGSCLCVTPGDCIAQTSCPSQANCNGSGICAP